MADAGARAFFGIVIWMFVEAGAVITCTRITRSMSHLQIDPIELMAGSLPKRQQYLVLAWAEYLSTFSASLC